MWGVTLALLLVAIAFGAGWLLGRAGIGKVVDPGSLPALEREFQSRMRDVVLVGSYTVDGAAAVAASSRSIESTAEPDRYQVDSVQKVGPDLWRFNAVLSCCGINGAIPVTVPMRWVGDTPVLMMTDTSLPGVGTFTVRLFFYEDRYAGTWQHGERGGSMSGRIEKREPSQ
jgi:hypothetical protein